jgi:acetate kinase
MNILCINPGSATLKHALFDVKDHSHATCTYRDRKRYDRERQFSEILTTLLSRCQETCSLSAIAVRVVHGGERFTSPTIVTEEVLAHIEMLTPLAPLHNPLALSTLRTCLKDCRDIPAIAIFDTTFHATIPMEAKRYALPYQLSEKLGIYRYGFHGIAHHFNYIALSRHQESRRNAHLISCHLGSGSSLCAILHGKSIDTTMGFTPLGGIPMGTRCGDIDPGIITFLQRENGMTPGDIDELLNHHSGLLGLSGKSADLQELERLTLNGDARSEAALDLLSYRIATTIGAYQVALGGLDALVFSGGIGQHSAFMRTSICHRLTHLGIVLDPGRNTHPPLDEVTAIHGPASTTSVWIVATDEEQLMALEACKVRESR